MSESAVRAQGSTEWRSSVTAFTVTRRASEWLMLRHERLGVTKWEVPGGHVDHSESLEQTAARETVEETGVTVTVGSLLATCIHEWPERRQRKLICFFSATPTTDTVPQVPRDEPDLIEARWVNPLELKRNSVTAFCHPLIEQQEKGWGDTPLHFRMTHRKNESGLYEPVQIID